MYDTGAKAMGSINICSPHYYILLFTIFLKASIIVVSNIFAYALCVIVIELCPKHFDTTSIGIPELSHTDPAVLLPMCDVIFLSIPEASATNFNLMLYFWFGSFM